MDVCGKFSAHVCDVCFGVQAFAVCAVSSRPALSGPGGLDARRVSDAGGVRSGELRDYSLGYMSQTRRTRKNYFLPPYRNGQVQRWGTAEAPWREPAALGVTHVRYAVTRGCAVF